MDKLILEDIVQDQEKNHDLKSLTYKFFNYSLESTPTYLKRKIKTYTSERAYNLFYSILIKKKEGIINCLEYYEKDHFILLINKDYKERFLELNDSEIKAIQSNFDKSSLYSFLLRYSLLLNKNQAFLKAREIVERVLDLAEGDRSLIRYGRRKKVLKIGTHSNKKTVIFKKGSQEYDAKELGLEQKTWMAYYMRLRSLLFSNRLEHDKNKQKYYFNLPDKLAFFDGELDKNSVYLVWVTNSKDLLDKILKSDGGTKKELIRMYLKEIAKLDAFGPSNLVPKYKYLNTKELFLKRMGFVVSKKIPSQQLIRKLMNSYDVIAKKLGESKVKGVVKDAILKNAVCTNKKVICIDFDRLRIAPLQMDLSKLLILSYDNKHELLKEFIKEYNSATDFFNKKFANRNFFSISRSWKKEPEKQLIKDKKEFYFVYLNSVIDYALHFLLEDEYNGQFGDLDIKNIQKNNALSAIEELKTKYRNNHTLEEIKQLESLSEIFRVVFAIEQTKNKSIIKD